MKTAFQIFITACFLITIVTYFAEISSTRWGDWFELRNPFNGPPDQDPEAPQQISHTFAHGSSNGMWSIISGTASLMDSQNKAYEVKSPNPKTYLIGFVIGFFASIFIPYVLIKLFSSKSDGRDSDDSGGMSLMNAANPLSPFNPIHKIY